MQANYEFSFKIKKIKTRWLSEMYTLAAMPMKINDENEHFWKIALKSCGLGCVCLCMCVCLPVLAAFVLDKCKELSDYVLLLRQKWMKTREISRNNISLIFSIQKWLRMS